MHTENIFCFYVEHSFFEAKKIGEIYNYLKTSSLYCNPKQILICTCQRIEIYSLGEPILPLELQLPFRILEQKTPVLKRLISICSGIRSQILGERNIYKQMEINFKNIDQDHPFKPVFENSLKIGKDYREQFQFKALQDYEDVAIHLLGKHAGNSSVRFPSELVIVGSGMLAKGFIEKLEVLKRYSKISFITRSPKSLKKHFKESKNVKVYSINNSQIRLPSSYHCILATSQVTEDYRKKLSSLLNPQYCKAIFDLSAVPIFANRPVGLEYYSDSYQEDYSRQVERNNQVIAHKATAIAEHIEKIDPSAVRW